MIRRALRKTRQMALRLANAATDARLGIVTMTPDADIASHPDPEARNARYEPLNYPSLEQIARRLAAGPDEVIYDIGCGMGRVVCYFARHRVKKVVGVDLDADLLRACEQNLTRLRGRKAPVELRNIDATEGDYSDATAVILFNPFGAEVLRAVLAKLQATVQANGRAISLYYAFPAHKQVFAEFPAFRQTDAFSALYRTGRMDTLVFQARA
jgi:cyclopropane fatty-acyl-phospholipid synthase-like methyltransferase